MRAVDHRFEGPMSILSRDNSEALAVLAAGSLTDIVVNLGPLVEDFMPTSPSADDDSLYTIQLRIRPDSMAEAILKAVENATAYRVLAIVMTDPAASSRYGEMSASVLSNINFLASLPEDAPELAILSHC